MTYVRFTQSINLSVEVEANVPNDWTQEDIESFAKDYGMTITLHELEDELISNVGLSIDGAETTDATVWEVKVEA